MKVILEEVLDSLGGVDIALLGLGAVSSNLLRIILQRGTSDILRVKVGVDISKEAIRRFRSAYPDIEVSDSSSVLWNGSHQLVVEAASLEAVREIAEPVLASGKYLLILSSGALVGWRELERLRGKGFLSRLWLSGGALGPLSFYEYLRILSPEALTLETSKPPRSLGLETHESKTLFKGDIEEAIRRFPKNVNVAGFLKTCFSKVPLNYNLIVDPKLPRNTHRLDINLPLGEISLKISSKSTDENPRTSLITVYSLYYDLLLLGIYIKAVEG